MSTVKLVINIGRITVTKYGTTPVNKKKKKKSNSKRCRDYKQKRKWDGTNFKEKEKFRMQE